MNRVVDQAGYGLSTIASVVRRMQSSESIKYIAFGRIRRIVAENDGNLEGSGTGPKQRVVVKAEYLFVKCIFYGTVSIDVDKRMKLDNFYFFARCLPVSPGHGGNDRAAGGIAGTCFSDAVNDHIAGGWFRALLRSAGYGELRNSPRQR